MKLKFNHPEPKEGDRLGRKYWKSLDEAADAPEFRQWLEREFPAGAAEMDSMTRGEFLKLGAASMIFAGFGLTGCREPKQHILPYSKQPERIVPGVPIFYASSMPTAEENIPLVVETHGARPTKIEGNPSYKTNGGATNIFAQASILNLYDPDRIEGSYGKDKKSLSRAEVVDLLKALNQYKGEKSKGLAFLAEQSTSPTRQRIVKKIKKEFPEALWVEYEPLDFKSAERSLSKVLGKSVRPYYHFDKAKRVLSLDSNFLHNEPGSIGYSRAFANARRVENAEETLQMNRLYAVESDFTITGGMADHRLRLASSHIPAFACLVAAGVFEQLGGNGDLVASLRKKAEGLDVDEKWLKECVKDLVENKGSALIVPGVDLPEEIQVLVASVNAQLDPEGQVVSYLEIPQGVSDDIEKLTSAIEKESVETLVILGGNPAYNAKTSFDWNGIQKKVGEIIRFGYYFDETSQISDFNIAANHYLETWGDGYTYDGIYVPVQPMILPLFEGFSELEVLGYILGENDPNAYQMVKETFESQGKGVGFDEWLALGVDKGDHYPSIRVSIDNSKLATLIDAASIDTSKLSIDNLEVRFVPSNQVWDGRYANNGWLQECSDPMTKLSWDNAICISPRLAKELQEKTGIQLLPEATMMNEIGQLAVSSNNTKRGREQAFIAELTINGKTIRGPLNVQLGLASYTIVIPVGYGRQEVGRIGDKVGFDVYPLVTSENKWYAVNGQLKVTEEIFELANTQEHWSVEGRAVLREACAPEYRENPDFVNQMGLEAHSPAIYGTAQGDPLQAKVRAVPRGGSIYKTPDFTGVQQWAMSIDLNTCTGCNACVVACQSENNIPIVGKQQMLIGREMHWIRIDRYFSDGGAHKTELPEDPQVSFMGMLCQHCELAPCESVCPVNATVHDSEGLNVMAYNRCVGTRYCANNCPYKVRRFNFFDWNKRSIGHFYEGPLGPSGKPEIEKMQKNPDVTIRMRGVMEKCTFCLQRIEEAKINKRVEAKDSGNVLVKDGVIKTACQQVCPTESIVFGDVADATTRVSKLKAQDRNYSVLGYLNTRPRVTYLARIRNPNPAMPECYKNPLSREEYESRYGHKTHAHEAAVEMHGA
jgi:MoCo/4Fe-4S cofactor protein with predicted Tat translocation signal